MTYKEFFEQFVMLKVKCQMLNLHVKFQNFQNI